MTLNTPSIHLINAFDPSNEYTFIFYYVGNQIYSNRAIITDNDTQAIVYDNIQNTMKNLHVLPSETLTAGKSYTIQIQVFDNDGNSSDLSMAVLFYCFSSPLFYFQNINNGDTISTANLELKLSYEQSENELLSEYKYNVYDGKKEEIYSSKIYYGTSEELTHTIYGLKNESTYFLRATGITSHGVSVDTGYVEIHVSHTTIKPDIAFVATNDNTNGCVVLQTNIFTVSYDVENNNYSVQDGLVDLKDNILTYKTGANGDFSLVLNAKQLPIGTFLNCNDNLLCLSVVCISDVYYCNLQIKTRSETYNIFKELTDVIVKDDNYIVLDESMYSDDTLFSFGIHRNNNVYDLQLYHSSIGILKSAQGTIISITDSIKVKPKNIKLFGKSNQDGTPSMDNEVAVESVGDSGSIGGKVLTSNFFDAKTAFASQIEAGVVTVNDDGSVVLHGTFNNSNRNFNVTLPSGTFYLSESSNTLHHFFTGYDDLWIARESKPTVLEQEKTAQCYINSGTYDNVTIYPMISTTYGAEFEPYTEQPFTFQTPNGLRGIPLGQTIPDAIKNSSVHMSGVYHDGEQYWIGDTKNENGKDVQRVFKTTIDGNSNIWDYGNPKTLSNIFGLGVSGIVQNSLVLCNNMTCYEVWGGDFEGIWVGADDSVSFRLTNDLTGITTEDSSEQKVAKVKELLTNNPIEIYYWKKDEPIITDTTEEEKTQLDALVMNYPNTTIVNDEGAYMEVEYVADTQMYILK